MIFPPIWTSWPVICNLAADWIEIKAKTSEIKEEIWQEE